MAEFIITNKVDGMWFVRFSAGIDTIGFDVMVHQQFHHSSKTIQ